MTSENKSEELKEMYDNSGFESEIKVIDEGNVNEDEEIQTKETGIRQRVQTKN